MYLKKGVSKMREVVFSAVRPLILGDGKLARRTAWRFFAEYGVMSTVLDKKRTIGSYFSLFSSFRHLPPTSSDDFILMSLERVADETPDVTLIVTPCNEIYRDLIKRNLAWFESRFIIRAPEKVCDVRPTQRHRIKD